MANHAHDPTDLAADESRVAAIAVDFADAIVAAVPAWIERILLERLTAAGVAVTDELRRRVHDAGASTLALVGQRVREVVTADVDARVGSPLAVLRAGVSPATEALRESGVAPVGRDDFATRNFPDDVYNLGPAAFADVAEALVEPGVVWGAARAHVHLRRRGTRS